MGMLRRIIGRAAALLLATTLILPVAGCNALLDSTLPEAHPPVISSLTFSPTSVTPEATVLVEVTYSDAGADITSCTIRDDMSGIRYEWTTATNEEGVTVNPFDGASGLAQGTLLFTGAQSGKHHMVLWCVDELLSKSNVLEGDITLTL